jgi:ribonuclease P protein component
MKNKIVGTSLRQNSQIKNVLKNGLTISSDAYIIKYIKGEQNFEFAISTNKKIFRTAVIRNKIKRQIRSFIRKLPNLKPIKLLIIVKVKFLDNSYERNYLSLEKMIKKVK